jgi:hypothetical protein
MGRIRTIKPDFHTNVDLSALPAEAHLLASGLLCYSDDEGYFDAHPKLVQAAIFPLRDLQNKIEDLMQMLITCGYITVESVKGKSIGRVVTFTTHQRVNRPTPSRLRTHLHLIEDSLSKSSVSVISCSKQNAVITHGVLTEDSLPEGKGKEEEKEGKGAHVISPDMIARGVITELGLGGRELVSVIEEVCRSQVKHYDSPGALRDSMVDSWRQYDTAKPSLAYTKGAAKFFGDGDWRNMAGWPWKDGKHPVAKSAPKYDTSFDEMVERAKQESRVQ